MTQENSEGETATQSNLQNTRAKRRKLLKKRSVAPGHDGIARHYTTLVWRLIIPISVCIFTVVWSVKNLSPIFLGDENASAIPMIINENSQKTNFRKFGSALVNALVVVVFIAVLTFGIVLLYRYRCMKILSGWLIFSVMTSLSFEFSLWIDLFCVHFQIPYDYVSLLIILWNFSVVGSLSIFFYAHPFWRQAFLVFISILIAWLLTNTPAWTTWCVLAAVSLYDIVAVLCPKGPLALLLKEADKNEEPIPGLVYVSQSGTMTKLDMSKVNHTSASESINPDHLPENARMDASDSHEISIHEKEGDESGSSENSLARNGTNGSEHCEEKQHDRQNLPEGTAQYEYEVDSFMLGLGDFIFYSLLVGRAAFDSYFSWVVSYLAIIFGFCTTLLCLAITERALPALPFSIFYGIIFYFISYFILRPYSLQFTLRGVYT